MAPLCLITGLIVRPINKEGLGYEGVSGTLATLPHIVHTHNGPYHSSHGYITAGGSADQSCCDSVLVCNVRNLACSSGTGVCTA